MGRGSGWIVIRERDAYTRLACKMSLEVESVDIVRLILQYLKEANLNQTAATLSEETGIVR